MSRRKEANEKTGESDMKAWIIPNHFCVNPFYKQGDTIHVRTSLADNLRHCPFVYDIAHADGLEVMDQPWQQWRSQFPHVFTIWEKVNEELIAHFRKRDKKAAKEPMIAMIALLMDAIFWLNERSLTSLVNWEAEIIELEIYPVNIVERMQFMLESPDHFHSYHQLKSLFMEVEKSYFRKLAINK